MVTVTHLKIEDSRRLKPPGRFPLGTKVAEFPTYRVFLCVLAGVLCTIYDQSGC